MTVSADVSAIVSKRNIGKASGLLESLVPRAQMFCFYDADKQIVWNSDGGDDYEVDSLVADVPVEVLQRLLHDEDSLRRSLPSGRMVFALPVADEESKLAGLLTAVFSKNDGKSSAFNPSLLKKILDPAVEMIGESIQASKRTDKLERRLAELSNELDLVYDVDQKIHGSSGRHSGLAQLVGRSGRYLGINYTVLLIPSKRIRISATHSSWKSVNRKVLDRYLIDQLLPTLEGQRAPVIFEIPADDAPDSAKTGYQALLCPLLDRQGNVEGVLAQLGRVNHSKFSRRDRRFMAHIGRKVEYVIEQSFDSMTGLMSRKGFEAQLRESFGDLQSDDDCHQLIYFDLDNLQLVNDTFGRKAGDDVIMRFSRLLETDLPKSAVLSRLTGDDFCMLLTHADVDAAMDYAKKVRENAKTLRYLEGDKSLQVTMSIGIAGLDNAGDEGNALTTARMACEAAKDHGRDRIEVYADGNRSLVRRYDDMQLVAEIQQALDADEFQLMAQPIASLSDDDANPGFEILLRMVDSDGEPVETAALFSAAERYRMMPQIDRWVVSSTLSRLAEARDVIDGQGAAFAMNLSGQSLGDDDFLEFIEHELKQSRLPTDSVCFEITESAAVSNLQKAQAFIDRLRSIGCRISLDDFGAGLSSFAYLKNFNVDTLKIDGGFIRDITENRISESMVAAITQVAKVMELKTVAEYVESEETRELVRDLGVNFVQGHFIGRPVALESALDGLGELLPISELS